MKELLTSWRESLALLRPSSFKLLGLATLNAWVKAWKVGWMYVVPLGVMAGLVQLQSFNTHPILRACLGSLSLVGMLGFFIAAARPSINRKDIHYFYGMFRDHISFLMLLVTLTFLPLKIFANPLAMIPKSIVMLYGILVFAVIAFPPFSNFLILFLFDSPPWRLKSYLRTIGNSCILLFYNLPLLVILAAIQIFVALLLLEVASVLILLLRNTPVATLVEFMVLQLPLLSFFLLSVFNCLWVNIYIKRVHDQPHLYL